VASRSGPDPSSKSVAEETNRLANSLVPRTCQWWWASSAIPPTSRSLWVWYPAVDQIGEVGLRIVDLRNLCASLLMAAGAHPGNGWEHVGHSSI